MALPTSPFSVADSIYAGKSVVSLKIPAGGSAIVFETYKLENDYSIQEKSIKMPGTDGVLRKVRSQTTEEDDNWKFALPEAKRLLTIFTNKLAGRVTGTATLYIPDPTDASGKCALVSETDFAVTVTRDGSVTFGDSDFTIPTIKIESNKTTGAVTWTKDATV